MISHNHAIDLSLNDKCSGEGGTQAFITIILANLNYSVN